MSEDEDINIILVYWSYGELNIIGNINFVNVYNKLFNLYTYTCMTYSLEVRCFI